MFVYYENREQLTPRTRVHNVIKLQIPNNRQEECELVVITDYIRMNYS